MDYIERRNKKYIETDDMGGTMRLGAQKAELMDNSLVRKIMAKPVSPRDIGIGMNLIIIM